MDKLMDEERTYLTLDEVHEELLNLLLRFDAFCKEHNLHYSLDSGTLLVLCVTVLWPCPS